MGRDQEEGGQEMSELDDGRLYMNGNSGLGCAKHPPPHMSGACTGCFDELQSQLSTAKAEIERLRTALSALLSCDHTTREDIVDYPHTVRDPVGHIEDCPCWHIARELIPEEK